MKLTPEQIESFNGFQDCGMMHPLTCPHSHENESRDLVATEDGLKCQNCDYIQDWVHNYMLDGSWKCMLENSPLHKAIMEARKQKEKE